MMSRDKVHPLGQDFTASSLLKFAFPTMVTMVFMGLYTIGDTILVSRFVSTDALSAVNIVTPVINLIVKFAFPTMVTMVFMGLYTIGDTILVSRFVSTDALSAVNIVTPVINLIVRLGSMIAMGGSAVIARKLGEGKKEEASEEFTLLLCFGAVLGGLIAGVGLGSMIAMGGSAVIARKLGEGKKEEASEEFTLLLCFGAVLGGLIAGVGTLLCSEIIHSLGSGPRLFPYCRAYLSVLFLFTPASILQVLFQNLIIAAGRPGLGMALSVGAGLVNVLLDLIFMVLFLFTPASILQVLFQNLIIAAGRPGLGMALSVGAGLVNVLLDLIFMGMFHMGIAGSALGTGIGYLIPTVVGAAFFMRERGGISFRKPALHFQVLIESCVNGCSELISQAAAAVTTFLFNRIMMGLLGEDGVAAVTIMIYSQFLLTALYIGFSMGVSPVISYQLGAQNHRNLSRIMGICLTFIVSVSVFLFALSMTFGSALVTVFSPVGTPVYEIAAKGFPVFSFSFLFCGVGIFASAAFTALSDGKTSAFISFLRTFGLITLFLMILPDRLGVLGVWLSVPAAELAAALSDGKTSAFISFLRTFGLITLFLMILPDRLGVLGVWLSVPAAELAAMAVSIFCLKRAAGKKNACISGKSVIG